MKLRLHANATTTPKTRAYIQNSTTSVAELSRELGISQTAVRRWRGRASTEDRSHARHDLGQSTTPEQEAIIAQLRTTARLSLDDITEVMRRCLAPNLSRSAVYRCLRRMGLTGVLADASPASQDAPFHPEPFGFVHVDLKYLGKLNSIAEFAFVAIERVSRFAYVEILPDRSVRTVTAAWARFLAAFGHPVHTVLTDNGSEFTDRFNKGSKAGHAAKPSGAHPFDKTCAEWGIAHRLTRPYRPQTNGMVERFNRRLSDAIRALPQARNNGRHRTHFIANADRAAFLLTFVENYNRTRLRCLNYKAPLDVLNNQTEYNTPGVRGPVVGLRGYAWQPITREPAPPLTTCGGGGGGSLSS
jgi:transposase InsO family protein